MTDTTDIAALRNKFGTKLLTADDAKAKFIELLNGPHASSWFLSPYVVALLDAFEAERQRAENWKVSFENERTRADKLAEQLEASEAREKALEDAFELAEDMPADFRFGLIPEERIDEE